MQFWHATVFAEVEQLPAAERRELLEHLYGDSEETLSNVLDVFVGSLRRKLGSEIVGTRRRGIPGGTFIQQETAGGGAAGVTYRQTNQPEGAAHGQSPALPRDVDVETDHRLWSKYGHRRELDREFSS